MTAVRKGTFCPIMVEKRYVLVETVLGDLKAEMLRGLLQAQGVPVILSKEGYARALGLNVGPLGEVEILVPAEKLALAHQVLKDYYAGVFAAGELYNDGESGDMEADETDLDN
ncbi:MAG TPA: DUF2007 domain-containing protein [Anaerolineales bacterium]|nr:DUF2007 domain-containing protein [Anaerolineales bacterium]